MLKTSSAKDRKNHNTIAEATKIVKSVYGYSRQNRGNYGSNMLNGSGIPPYTAVNRFDKIFCPCAKSKQAFQRKNRSKQKILPSVSMTRGRCKIVSWKYGKLFEFCVENFQDPHFATHAIGKTRNKPSVFFKLHPVWLVVNPLTPCRGPL